MATKRAASPSLEAFIDEGIEHSKVRGYNPTIFIGMRQQHGTIEAIERLVQSGDNQSGFKRLQQLKLFEWTIEAAVTKFPNEFGRHARKCAEWRLAQVKKKPSAR
jgi:hypothetical protein